MAHDAIQAIKQLRREVVDSMRTLMKLAKDKKTAGMIPICDEMVHKVSSYLLCYTWWGIHRKGVFEKAPSGISAASSIIELQADIVILVNYESLSLLPDENLAYLVGQQFGRRSFELRRGAQSHPFDGRWHPGDVAFPKDHAASPVFELEVARCWWPGDSGQPVSPTFAFLFQSSEGSGQAGRSRSVRHISRCWRGWKETDRRQLQQRGERTTTDIDRLITVRPLGGPSLFPLIANTPIVQRVSPQTIQYLPSVHNNVSIFYRKTKTTITKQKKTRRLRRRRLQWLKCRTVTTRRKAGCS